jgi:hypothetical protein
LVELLFFHQVLVELICRSNILGSRLNHDSSALRVDFRLEGACPKSFILQLLLDTILLVDDECLVLKQPVAHIRNRPQLLRAWHTVESRRRKKQVLVLHEKCSAGSDLRQLRGDLVKQLLRQQCQLGRLCFRRLRNVLLGILLGTGI